MGSLAIEIAHLGVSALVLVVGIMIKLEISKLRIKTLEDERDLRTWALDQFASKRDGAEHHLRGRA